jgi:hypothetical protein
MKWLLKTLSIGILWIFILSIEVDNRSLFSYANHYLVRNQLVTAVDRQVSYWWGRLSQRAQMAFSGSEAVQEDEVTY